MMSYPDNNLATPNLLHRFINAMSSISHRFQSVTEHRYGFIVAVIMIALVRICEHKLKTTLLLLFCTVFFTNILRLFTYLNRLWTTYEVCIRKISEESKEGKTKLPARATLLFTHFSVDELRSATRNFSRELIIGRGGFGFVYKGLINRQQTVAIKRLGEYSRQGCQEFLTEIKTLCEVRHVNLVSLVGYCDDHEEMILVYEYMGGGTLADHLHRFPRINDSYSPLTWKQRLIICIGSARGLDYLHTHRIIHHDVKATNILLDGNLIAKVADFGLAKPDNTVEIHSERLRGTRGYFDPHYLSNHVLTKKGDTYAFGVVLLEVLCDRPALGRMVEGEECTLAKWAQNRIKEGKVNEIVASRLIGEVLPDSLKTFVDVAQSCLQDEPKLRPTMTQVVVKLELALEQQEGRNISILDQETKVADVQTITHNPVEQTEFADEETIKTASLEQTNINYELTAGYKVEQTRYKHISWFRTLQKILKPTKREKPVSVALSTMLTAEETLSLQKALSEIRQVRIQEFDFDHIADTTNQFSNIIASAYGGNIYKGMLPSGQVIAVRKLSSKYSLTEFKSEILCLSKLQHCAVITLLGYYIHEKQRFLVYEFMENQSLAHHIHDERRSSRLDWALRFKIIVGIAKGIIYLHQDSGMRIIHKGIKPSKILLDANMNPKICDFRIAMTLEDHESVVEVSRIIGTYGYMAPEYALHGEVSAKSDVYSLGVLILVTLSGKKPIFLDIHRERTSITEYAWELWNQGKALDLVESSIRESASKEEALRCIQVGLLCTHREPGDRPTMATVLQILTLEKSQLDLHDKMVRASSSFSKYLSSGSNVSSKMDEVLGGDEASLHLTEINGMAGIDTIGASSTMAMANC